MDIAALILSTITAGLSALAAIMTYFNNKKTSYGNLELQIRTMISDAKYRQLEWQSKLISEPPNEVLQSQYDVLTEEVLNAYDEACAKYNDGKVDKARFKKMYFHEIRQLVEDDNFKDKYSGIQSRYNATKKVYDEWNNLENH